MNDTELKHGSPGAKQLVHEGHGKIWTFNTTTGTMVSEEDHGYPGLRVLDTDYQSYLIIYNCAQHNWGHNLDSGEEEEGFDLNLALYVRDTDIVSD